MERIVLTYYHPSFWNEPNGVQVSYDNNGAINVGEYTVTAKFVGDINHNAIADMTATITVVKGTYDMGGVTFEDASFTYDGSAKKLAVSGNLPTGVKVVYKNNSNVNAGVYTVTAQFIGNENYNEIADMTATLTINKADLYIADTCISLLATRLKI